MKTLRDIISDAEGRKVAVGHFNIANLEQAKAITEIAKKLNVPVILGVSEGEREFIGVHEVVALVKSLREDLQIPIFLNADHTHSLEKVKEAAEAGFDAILFDGSKLQFEENIKQTKEAAKLVKKINGHILVEGEIGNIGSGSEVRKELPEGAAIRPEEFTKPEEAARFVRETGVGLLAPAVGNIHGMFANAPEPPLNIEQIRAIKDAAQIPLVLHGGSGNTDEEILRAIDAGISVVHISTEIRVAWRKGLEESLKEHPKEVAPYKVMPEAIAEMEKVVEHKLRLFGGLK